MIRSGYLALRMIADFYQIAPELAPSARSEISVTRAQFDILLEKLRVGGIQLDIDPDVAWSDFAGWRVNYDHALEGLKALVAEVPAHWDESD